MEDHLETALSPSRATVSEWTFCFDCCSYCLNAIAAEQSSPSLRIQWREGEHSFSVAPTEEWEQGNALAELAQLKIISEFSEQYSNALTAPAFGRVHVS